MLPLSTGREAKTGKSAPPYVRHRPERTLLYQLIEKAELAREIPGGEHAPTLEQGIELRDVSFSYEDKKILDEATTALDPQSEADICNALRKLRGVHTILSISHQPAMFNAADRAYRLQDGHALLEKDHAG